MMLLHDDMIILQLFLLQVYNNKLHPYEHMPFEEVYDIQEFFK